MPQQVRHDKNYNNMMTTTSHSLIRNTVRTLSLSHFRNYHSVRIEVSDSPVVLIGPNGAGKTNVLEAISLLTPGRGIRRAKLSDIDRMDSSAPWAVAAEVAGLRGETSIGTGRSADEENSEKRIVKIDGKAARSQTELGSVFAALWLTPQMDNLFIEGGTARRKFLDRLIYSFDGEHATRVNAYDFAMRERNRLLQDGRADPVWLCALEQKMAEQGIAIAVARQHGIEGLNNAVMLSAHSFPKVYLSLAGFVEDALAQRSALETEEAFKEKLAAARAQDAATGRTGTGIHRSELGVLHVEKNMVAERCSTGEQKALLVSIILAQARAGAAWHGRIPALLLDEVVTHLDATRRAELFAELSSLGAQSWLTSTDRDLFGGFDAQFLTVKPGHIKP